MDSAHINKLKETAVELAINGEYVKAIEINNELLKIDPQDTDCLMQLAHAYWQTGDLKLAKKYYSQTLEIDPANNLAKKRIALLNAVSSKQMQNKARTKSRIVPISELIEEPGKTKTVRLSSIGKPEHLSLLSIGEEVFLSIRKRKIEVRDSAKNFIGYLPDDISKRLAEMIEDKCVYEALVFSFDKNEIKIFLREMHKSARYRNKSSFIYEETAIKEDDDNEDEVSVDPEEEVDLLLSPEEILEKETKVKDDDHEDETEREDKEEQEIYSEYEE
jgi:tetratricopeptide (TPR) repeat protein